MPPALRSGRSGLTRPMAHKTDHGEPYHVVDNPESILRKAQRGTRSSGRGALIEITDDPDKIWKKPRGKNLNVRQRLARTYKPEAKHTQALTSAKDADWVDVHGLVKERLSTSKERARASLNRRNTDFGAAVTQAQLAARRSGPQESEKEHQSTRVSAA